MQILLIEHDDVETLFPFTETHCSWELRVGVYTILERWQQSTSVTHITVASHREQHVRSFVERFPQTGSFVSEPTLIMSGHILLSPFVMQQMIDTCINSTQPILFFCGGHAVGIYVNTPLTTSDSASSLLRDIDVETCRTIEISGHSIGKLWNVLDHIDAAIRWDSELMYNTVNIDSIIHPTVIVDESEGPVVVMEGARIGAYSVLHGPVVIGRDAVVKPHAQISHSVIGPVCKVSGEIEHSILHGYSNKQHDGYLGHSFLGEWVNIGAGTNTSDLKNTYGHITVTMPWGSEDTQRIFIGLLSGDHSKTAIGTMFKTGTVCGVNCNVTDHGFPPKYIPSFSWMDTEKTTLYDINKAIDVARIVMARRLIDLGPETEKLLRLLHSKSHV